MALEGVHLIAFKEGEDKMCDVCDTPYKCGTLEIGFDIFANAMVTCQNCGEKVSVKSVDWCMFKCSKCSHIVENPIHQEFKTHVNDECCHRPNFIYRLFNGAEEVKARTFKYQLYAKSAIDTCSNRTVLLTGNCVQYHDGPMRCQAYIKDRLIYYPITRLKI